MSYVLMIAEKQIAAERIAKALAQSQPKKIRKYGVSYFEFTRNGKKHICVPAVGHLFVLDTTKKGKWTYPIFDMKWIPTFMKRGKNYVKKYYEVIEELAKNASDYIVCCDFDTEGEVIGYNILRFVCNRNDAKRMKFSTLTKDELIESYETMLPHLDFGQAEAGLTRHFLDFFWGINTTRALTLAMRTQTDRGFQIISSGRVQGPTLKILLDRELEIRNFVPKPFWQLELHCKVNGFELIAMHEKDKFWNREEALKILEECKGKDAKVKDVKKKRYKQKPPYPFNTTNLQTECYNQFKFSPRQTMNIAESLYQQGFISYPRSNSQKFPATMDYKKIIKALATLPQYKNLCEELLRKKELKPHEGPKTDPAHPAVVITHEVPDLKKLTSQEKKLYDLIARRTLACFADEAIRESMKVTLTINNQNFITTGKRTVEPGWIKFYEPYVKYEEQILPDLRIGQILKVLRLQMLEKETQPPPRYTQGSIIKEMDARGLGTRATRQEILQTLYDRGYIKGKSIEVTKFGETVVEVLKEYCPRILSEKLTRHFEEEMEMVRKGKKKREEVIEEAKRVLTNILSDFKKNEKEIGKKLLKAFINYKRRIKTLGECPQCGGDLKIVISKKSGKAFVGCSSYPKCQTSYPLPGFGRIVATEKVCEKCNTPIIMVYRRGKRPFSMCLDPKCPSKESWSKKNK
jgi:DNA topoisomerase-1